MLRSSMNKKKSIAALERSRRADYARRTEPKRARHAEERTRRADDRLRVALEGVRRLRVALRRQKEEHRVKLEQVRGDVERARRAVPIRQALFNRTRRGEEEGLSDRKAFVRRTQKALQLSEEYVSSNDKYYIFSMGINKSSWTGDPFNHLKDLTLNDLMKNRRDMYDDQLMEDIGNNTRYVVTNNYRTIFSYATAWRRRHWRRFHLRFRYEEDVIEQRVHGEYRETLKMITEKYKSEWVRQVVDNEDEIFFKVEESKINDQYVRHILWYNRVPDLYKYGMTIEEAVEAVPVYLRTRERMELLKGFTDVGSVLNKLNPDVYKRIDYMLITQQIEVQPWYQVTK